MQTKKVIQRALPLNVKYSFVSATYISLVDGGGTCCDNCGKLIANMVTVMDEAGKKFVVGSDCAETLTTVNDPFEWKGLVSNPFSEGKRIRSKIAKHIKAGNITGVELKSFKSLKTGLEVTYIQYLTVRPSNATDTIYYPEVTLNYIKEYIK